MAGFGGRVATKLEQLAWRHRGDVMRKKYQVDPTFEFQPGARIYGSGQIVLGPDSYLNYHAQIEAAPGCTVRVGRGCRIGPNVRIYTCTVDPDADLSVEPVAQRDGDVVLEDWVWVGANVYIGPGVTVGTNAVLGANSVVTRDVEPYEIVAGAPLRHLRYKSSRPA